MSFIFLGLLWLNCCGLVGWSLLLFSGNKLRYVWLPDATNEHHRGKWLDEDMCHIDFNAPSPKAVKAIAQWRKANPDEAAKLDKVRAESANQVAKEKLKVKPVESGLSEAAAAPVQHPLIVAKVGEPIVKGKVSWTPEEDQNLQSLVEIHGRTKWSFIGKFLPGRAGKQCRERW